MVTFLEGAFFGKAESWAIQRNLSIYCWVFFQNALHGLWALVKCGDNMISNKGGKAHRLGRWRWAAAAVPLN